ncbi:hypothetical protein K0M31_015820 [Melipona bicolor]|uniref:Uncharacterized protein n=1 Tax=Melipona bicolor TaxID=60889 RepID=A0AA40FEP7_9HYME|nr:hypothetical protein K0M31_015820 [Melipona bicolor]
MATSQSLYKADHSHLESIMADNQQLKDNLAAIQHQLAQLTYKIATMETNFSHQRSFQRRSRSCDRRSPARQYTPTEGLCCYHFNFGARAYKCQKPCNWSPTTTETAQQKEN